MATNQASMTAEELLALGDIGRCELIRGELVRMSPSGFKHGIIALRIGELISAHVRRHGLGLATGAETGFRIARDPDTVRAPDAAFVAAHNLPNPLPGRGFFPGAPDLAVEVVSPEDRWTELTAKAQSWLQAGSRAVWILDPANRTVTVYASDGTHTLSEADVLTGGDILPGFAVPVRDIFAGL